MNLQQLLKYAEAGDLKAQWDLSNMYYEGNGVTQDNEKAFYWTSKAALQGHITSQFNLGFLYSSGIGTLEDSEEAIF